MSIRNYVIVCFLLNFILINNLYGSNDSQKSILHISSRDCEGLSQDECTENPECDWSIVTTPNGVFEMCVDADDWGGDGGWNFDCEGLTEDECVYVPWCSWNEEDGCYRPDNWNDDGGWQSECDGLSYEDCEYLDFCEWISDSDNPNSMGFCVEAALDDGGWNDDGGWQSECEGLSYEDCDYLDFCEWISDSPSDADGICVETGNWDDGGWESECTELTQDECTENSECDWGIVTTPNGIFEMCIDANDWNDDGGWQSECEGLSYEDCEYLDFCEWISDSDNPNNTGFCIDAGGPNPCSDFNQEDCEWYDECVWTDQGCQDYDWNDDCNPDMICGQALTCVDGLLYPTTCGPENCDNPIGVCDDNEDGGGDDCDPDLECAQVLTCYDGFFYPTSCGPLNCDLALYPCDEENNCEDLGYQECMMMDDCEWISDSNVNGFCIEGDGNDGPPECLLDCPGIEDINPSEYPYEACDWVISTFGNDPGFASCFNDCDEETVIEIYEIIEACFDCLSDTTLDCSDVFNDDDCSDLSMDECIDAEGCQPNYNAAGQFEGCEESNNQEGCFEDGGWFCYGCEYFINECEYFECTENGWDGPYILDECEEGDGGCDDGGDLLAYLELEDTVGMPGNEVTVPMYLTSPVPVGGVQFKLFENYDGITPSGITSMDDCFTANYNNLDEAFIGIIFSLEGCSYPPNETVHIANLVFQISHFVPVGIETNLEFDYTIVADFEGNEVSSCGIGSSILLGMQGDVNGDGEINVIDIVLAVSFAILTDYPSDSEFWASDVNNDGIINVLDIVQLVNMVLNG